MKTKFLLLIMISALGASLNAQSFNNLWKDVNVNLENKLPESAAISLNKIEQKAIKENNQKELLKTFLYRFKIFSLQDENPIETSIKFAEENVGKLQEPEKSIFNLTIAYLYELYSNDNFFKIEKNTPIFNHSITEMKFWDSNTFNNVIESYLNKALTTTQILKKTPTESYQEILSINDYNKEKIDYIYEPTLYDYISHSIINYYKSYNNSKNKALDLYQNLIEFDATNNYHDAVLYNEINLAKLEYEISQNFEDYFNRLKTIKNKNINNPLVTTVMALQAEAIYNKQKVMYQQQASTIITDNQLPTVLDICDEAIKLFPNSIGAKQCESIHSSILEKDLSLSMQVANVPNQAIPVALTYRNLTNPHYRIYKINQKELNEFENSIDLEIVLDLLEKDYLIENHINIPDEKDYLEHSSLIALPKLECGIYCIMFSKDDEFSKQNLPAVHTFQVSNLSFVKINQKDNFIIQVLDRGNGKPIKDVTVDISQKKYNYTEGKYINQKFLEMTTDKNGRVIVSGIVDQSFDINLYNGNDTLIPNSYFYFSTNKEDVSREHTHFYTDRAIYRPGQTVFFKGIMINGNSKNKELVIGKETKVTFKDNNWQEISSQTFTTNEFGSFDGSFVIPDNLSNGYFKIGNNSGNTHIIVEEYKRPTFEITFNAPDKSFKLNEEVELSGSVKAYAGFNLDNINYDYTVVRRAYFPYRLWWSHIYNDNEKQIAFGEGKTNANGEFNINFELLADENIKDKLPVFEYIVTINATNAQGEAQTKTYTIKASDNNLIIDFDNNNSNITIDNLNSATFSVKNIEEIPVKAKVIRKIYKIKDNERFVNDEFNFDRKLLSDKELKELFPHFDYYANEKSTKDNGNLIYEDEIIVDGQAKIFPNIKNLIKEGKYYVEIISSENKEEKTSNEFFILNLKNKEMPFTAKGIITSDTKTAKPGEKVNFYLGSSAKDVTAYVRILHNDDVRYSKCVKLDNEILKIPYKVKNDDRGLIVFEVFFVKYNTISIASGRISIPYDNLNLDIKLDVERDDLLPGANEKWNLTIKDYKNKGVLANLMAGMYDASLDIFATNHWSLITTPSAYTNLLALPSYDAGFNYFSVNIRKNYSPQYHLLDFNILSNYPLIKSYGYDRLYSYKNLRMSSDATPAGSSLEKSSTMEMVDVKSNETNASEFIVVEEEVEKTQETISSLRENFNETAFFYPNLITNDDGSLTMSFTMPDALTRWNLMMLAYTKDLKVGTLNKTFTTSKPLMIMSDMPRFVYENDTLWIVANVIRTTDNGQQTTELKPKAKLEIFDALTMQPLDLILSEQEIVMNEIPAGQSQAVRWKVAFGKDMNLLALRFSVTADNFSDAEQHLLPILSDEVFMTETHPLLVRENSEKTYSFDFDNNNERNQGLTLDICANPVWYAIQSLPYLSQETGQYADVAFYIFYANSLASYIAQNIPNFSDYINKWELETTEALMSALQKDENLKAIMLKETPWVLEAKSESEQKAMLANLLDINNISNNLNESLNLIKEKQSVNGGWSWIEGMPESAFITRYILEGFGKLQKMNVINSLETGHQKIAKTITNKAIDFISKEVVKHYNFIMKDNKGKYYYSHSVANNLFALSYFDYKHNNDFITARNYFIEKLKEDWKKLDFSAQAKIALILHRNGEDKVAQLIVKSLKERAQKSETLGMYWAGNSNYFSSASLVKEHTIIMEAFDEINPDKNLLNEMKVWLLCNKRTNMWDNAQATVDAVYALLFDESTSQQDYRSTSVEIQNGNNTECILVDIKNGNNTSDFMSQYYWDANDINNFSDIKINNKTNNLVWGGLFRQYFVSIDEVRKHESPLNVEKNIYIERVNEKGTYLVPIENEEIKIGDKIVVNLNIESSQDMEFVFLKDLRAACLEQTEQMSRYKYLDGMLYYQSNSDTFMGFYFDNLPKGKHQVSYSMFATKEGSFSNGYALIQCMYSPEFSAYSEGIRINISCQ